MFRFAPNEEARAQKCHLLYLNAAASAQLDCFPAKVSLLLSAFLATTILLDFRHKVLVQTRGVDVVWIWLSRMRGNEGKLLQSQDRRTNMHVCVVYVGVCVSLIILKMQPWCVFGRPPSLVK